ncbi:NADAR family protein [Myxococcota bacterium]|nr:NADAR family protein [Myxococcota bacterium]
MDVTGRSRGQLEPRTYTIAECITFRKTNEKFGGLSNMSAGFPLVVCGIPISTSEALYQACRFPHLPSVQEMILREASPMTAKMRSKPHRSNSRQDWDRVKVRVMRWCLRVKLTQNWSKFSDLLLATGERPIVEFSMKDPYWGASPVKGQDGILVGANVLGRLLMELRVKLMGPDREALRDVDPPAVVDALLLGRTLERISGPGRPDRSVFSTPSRISQSLS